MKALTMQQSIGNSQTANAVLRGSVRPPEHTAATLQRTTVNNHAMQHLLRTQAIQAKLTVNTPNDEFEQEADCVADQVMRMSTANAAEPPPSIQRACSSCNKEMEAHPIQRMCDECDEEMQRKEASQMARDCPDPCGTMGTPCSTLTLPPNP